MSKQIISKEQSNGADKVPLQEAVEITQAGQPIIDLGKLAKPQDFAGMVEVTMTHLKVGKPKSEMFFRVHPDLYVDLTVYERELDMDTETYLIHGDVYMQVLDESGFRQKRYYFYQTKSGGLGLWGISLPDESGKLNSWAQSGHIIAEAGREKWVRAKSDRANGAYILVAAKIDMGEPEWPDYTLEKLLDLAFKDRIIASYDHDIIRSLRGEI